VDAGGAYRGYACDLTRTWPVGSRFTPGQAMVYDAVLRAQEAGIAAAKRGATFTDINAACDAVLKEAGLLEGRLHGPCHWVGLDVHDPNGNAPLEPGSVFVIEPGAYFPTLGFGVRIEDTFLMLEDGSLECLTGSVPKRREEIEAIRLANLPPEAEVTTK
jgi:Xaa-Pro aminopeptidase